MKFLIVDDHPVFRQGLCALLMQFDPDATITEAQDAAEAVLLIAQGAEVDLVILDMFMPGLSGFEAIAEVSRKRPNTRIIVLSSSEDVRNARRALEAGAHGYVPKSASHFVLLSAVRLVINGDLYVPPLILDRAVEDEDTNAGPKGLTLRQIEILNFMNHGTPNKVIARRMGVAEKTVKAHITAMFRILNVINRTQAVAVGRKAGLIQDKATDFDVEQ